MKIYKDDQEDTPERLAKIAKAYKRKNGIVHKIIQMFKLAGPIFVANNFQKLTFQELRMASKKNTIVINDYDSWHDEHGRYKIIEKVGDMWVLRPVIKTYFGY